MSFKHFTREIAFPAGADPKSFISLGRNGIMFTSGVELWVQKDEVRISPVNSRGNVGRGFITVPNDKEFLLQLASELTRIAQSWPDVIDEPSKNGLALDSTSTPW